MKRKNEAQSYCGTIMLLLLVIYLVVSLFMLGVLAISHEVRALPIVLIVFGAILVIPIIIHFILYIHYRNVELIHIQVTKFTSIDFSIFARDRAALVGTAIVNGEETKITTSYTFTTHNYSSHCASDYMDREVEVGYDPKWDKWVVIED